LVQVKNCRTRMRANVWEKWLQISRTEEVSKKRGVRRMTGVGRIGVRSAYDWSTEGYLVHMCANVRVNSADVGGRGKGRSGLLRLARARAAWGGGEKVERWGVGKTSKSGMKTNGRCEEGKKVRKIYGGDTGHSFKILSPGQG